MHLIYYQINFETTAQTYNTTYMYAYTAADALVQFKVEMDYKFPPEHFPNNKYYSVMSIIPMGYK